MKRKFKQKMHSDQVGATKKSSRFPGRAIRTQRQMQPEMPRTRRRQQRRWQRAHRGAAAVSRPLFWWPCRTGIADSPPPPVSGRTSTVLCTFFARAVVAWSAGQGVLPWAAGFQGAAAGFWAGGARRNTTGPRPSSLTRPAAGETKERKTNFASQVPKSI